MIIVTVITITAIVGGSALAGGRQAHLMGWRNANHDRLQAALVILGMTCAITLVSSSFVIAESRSQSIRTQAESRLGEVDSLVLSQAGVDERAWSESVSQLGRDFDADTAAYRQTELAVATGGAVLPSARVTKFEDTPSGWDDDMLVQLMSDGGYDPTQVVISERIAAVLGLEVGRSIVFPSVEPGNEYRVAAVVPERGLGYFVEMVVPAGILEDESVSWTSMAALSAAPTRSDELLTRLAELPSTGDTIPVRELLMSAAEEEREESLRLFLTASGFGVASALIVVINLVSLLIEARRYDHVLLRTMGWKPSKIMASLLGELLLYGMAATILGMAAGIGLGAVILSVLSGFVLPDGRILEMTLSVSPNTIAWSSITAVAISAVVAMAQLWRLRRVDVTTGAEEQRNRRLTRPPVWLLAAMTILVASSMYLADLERPAPWTFLAQGTMLMLMSTPLAIALVHQVGRRVVDNPRMPPWLLLAAYELRFRPGRVMLHALTVGLVVLATMFAASAAHLIGRQPKVLAGQIGGPYQILIEAGQSSSVDESSIRDVDGVGGVTKVQRFATILGPSVENEGSIWAVSVVDESFGRAEVRHGETDRSTPWTADIVAKLQDQQPIAIAPDGVGFTVGEKVTLWRNGVDPIDVEIAALNEHASRTGAGLIVPRSVAEGLPRLQTLPTQYFVEARSPERAGALVDQLNRRLAPQGATAATFLQLADEQLTSQTRLLQVLRAYTMLGLVAGAIGLSAVYTRHFYSREQEMVLLSVNGFQAGDVGRSIFAETSTGIGLGFVMGTVIGCYISWQMLVHGAVFSTNLGFAIPLTAIGTLAVASLLMMGVSSVVPMQLVKRLEPGLILSRE